MVGAFLIAETYIASLNLPILGISAVAGLGVILIVTALLSGRSPKKPEARATAATSAPEDAIRKD